MEFTIRTSLKKLNVVSWVRSDASFARSVASKTIDDATWLVDIAHEVKNGTSWRRNAATYPLYATPLDEERPEWKRNAATWPRNTATFLLHTSAWTGNVAPFPLHTTSWRQNVVA